MITKNKFVTVSYELRTAADAEPIEIADEKTPLEFICGQGQTLEYFEMNLLNLNTGNSFDFHIPSAGKTGTASVSKGTANGVFVAYAPYENPQIAIAVIAEHGAHGNYAAPVARDIIDAYFGVKTDENQKDEPNVIVSSRD